MTSFVVDASVAVKWYFREHGTDTAIMLLEHPSLKLLAPDILVAEVLNALLRREREGVLTAAVTDQAYQDLERVIPDPVPSVDLQRAAISLARELSHPLHDCIYLTLALRAGAVLITADEQFGKRDRAVHGMRPDRLILLSEFQPHAA